MSRWIPRHVYGPRTFSQLRRTPPDQLTDQERKLRGYQHTIHHYRWRLRNAENGHQILRYAEILATALKRRDALLDRWVVGPSGYKPRRLRWVMGCPPEPDSKPPLNPIRGDLWVDWLAEA